jgi:hypothetical protein
MVKHNTIQKMPRTKTEIITKNKKYKKNKPDSDSEDDSSFVSDSDSDSSDYSEIETPKSKKNKSKKTFADDCSENSDDLAELHKTLQSLFPSKYMEDKVKDNKKKKKDKKEKEREKEREREKSRRKHKSKKYESESEEEEDIDSNEEEDIVDSDDEETVYEDIDTDEEEDEDDNDDTDDKNYKITFTIGGQPALKNKVQSNLSNDEYGSDDEKTFMKETYENVEPIGMSLTPSVSNQTHPTFQANSDGLHLEDRVSKWNSRSR